MTMPTKYKFKELTKYKFKELVKIYSKIYQGINRENDFV